MLAREVIDEINSLDTLDGGNRVQRENELIKSIFLELNSINLENGTWELIRGLAGNFIAPYNQSALTKALIARAPTDPVAKELMDTLKPYEKKSAMEDKNIWRNIERLDAERHDDTPRLSAKEKWGKVKRIFSDTDESGRKIVGRALRDKYWREAYNLGQYEKVDHKWRDIWAKSNTDLGFVGWCKAIGLDSFNNSTAYYTDQERDSLRVNFKDGKLFDNNNQPVDTMKKRGYEEEGVVDIVMAVDKSLYSYGVSTKIHKEGKPHHSGILSGQPVLFAGEIGIQNGGVVKITTRSGHYEPTEKQLVAFLHVLQNKGVNLNNVVIKDDDGGQISANAETYLASKPSEHHAMKSRYNAIQTTNPNLDENRAKQLFFEKYNELTSAKKNIFHLVKSKLDPNTSLRDIFSQATGKDDRVKQALLALDWINSNGQLKQQVPECVKLAYETASSTSYKHSR